MIKFSFNIFVSTARPDISDNLGIDNVAFLFSHFMLQKSYCGSSVHWLSIMDEQ